MLKWMGGLPDGGVVCDVTALGKGIPWPRAELHQKRVLYENQRRPNEEHLFLSLLRILNTKKKKKINEP